MNLSISHSASSKARLAGASLSRPQLRDAQKAIIRYIWNEKLIPGDQLPGQQLLREKLGFSNDTLSQAMRLLEDQAILRRQPRVGTIVLDPARVPTGVWAIGLALPPFEHPHISPYYAVLSGYLQDKLGRMGCHIRLYPHTRGTPMADVYDPLHHFDHLDIDVEHGLVDGLITIYAIDGQVCWNLMQRGLLIAQTSANTKGGPLHVFFDGIQMIRESVSLLVSRGCRRLALLLNTNSRPEYFPAVNTLIEAFQSHEQTGSPRQVYRAVSRGMWGGCEIAADILAQPPDERPDGLVILDDYLTMGLTSTLASHPDYRPNFVTQANAQSPLAFSLPVTRYEIDIKTIADKLIELMISGLRNPDSLPQSIPLRAVTDGQLRQVPKDDLNPMDSTNTKD